MSAAADDACPPPEAHQPDDSAPAMRYGKSKSSALRALHAIASQLKEGQLKLALTLAALAEEDPHHSAAVSTRALAKAANLSESAVPAALRRLEELGHITTRHGTATRRNAYRVNFLDTVWGAPFAEAPPAPFQEAPPPLFEMHGAPFAEAPPTENTALADAAAALKISSSSLLLIDRVLSAKKQNFDQATHQQFRAWLHTYMCRLGRDDNNRPFQQDPPPPADDLVAQFLSIAEPRRLGTLLDSLMCDRHACYSYAWFITVALQRIHGLHFQEVKRARAALKVVRTGGRPTPEPTWTQQTLDSIEAIARAKAIR